MCATTARPRPDPDDQLVRRARAGDGDAYGDLVRPHRRSALRLATAVLGTSDGADDVVQVATERAWRSLHRFEVGRAFRPWLLRVVANTARNDRRARGRQARLAARAADDAAVARRRDAPASPEDLVVGDVDRRRVVAALNRLGADDRLVIALRHVEQLSEREVAEVLERPAGTVKSRLSRAMGRLRVELERDAVAVLVVGLVVAVGVALGPARAAVAEVAEWLQLGSVRIEQVSDEGQGGGREGGPGDPAGLPTVAAGLTPVPVGVAEASLGRSLPIVADPRLGPADLVAVAPEGGVLLGWDRGATTLWVRPTADPADVQIRKLLDEIDRARPLAGLGEGAVVVEGDHVLSTPDRRLAAGTVVLWIDGGLELRLESDLGVDAMVAIARSVTP